MDKTLDITIKTTSQNTFDIEIYESESGERVKLSGRDDKWEDIENDIGTEIKSWLSLIREQEDAYHAWE